MSDPDPMQELSAALPLAAILCPGDGAGDAALAAALGRIASRGLRLAGYVQRKALGPDGQKHLVVEDVTSGAQRDITQRLGPASRGCKLDPAALADVAGALLAALTAAPAPDLVILNRFGKTEAEGQGLRAVIEAALLAGIPVLTVVTAVNAPGWDDFTGGEATLLPAEPEAVEAWIAATLAQVRAQAA